MQVVSLETNAPTGAAPVEKWTPERRRARTRTALVDAARYVFARKGFEGASLDEIADTAGYTRGRHLQALRREGRAAVRRVRPGERPGARAVRRADRARPARSDRAVDDRGHLEGVVRRRRRRAHARSRVPALRAAPPRGASARGRPPGRNRDLVVEFMRAHSADGETSSFKVPLETLTSILLITADAFSSSRADSIRTPPSCTRCSWSCSCPRSSRRADLGRRLARGRGAIAAWPRPVSTAMVVCSPGRRVSDWLGFVGSSRRRTPCRIFRRSHTSR